MPKSELTKHLLAAALKELMANTPLDKISVQDIAEKCRLNRKTFYYHFKDKQELICWIFDTEFAGLHDKNQDNTVIDELIEHLYINKNFYISALTSDVQNNLREHLYKTGFMSIKSEIIKIAGPRKMQEEDVDFIAHFFSNALIGCLYQWAKEGMKRSPSEYISDFYHLFKESLEIIIDKRVKQQTKQEVRNDGH